MNALSARGWSLSELLGKGQHFKPVPRVSYQSPDLQGRIQQHESDGIPLVVEDWHHHPHWPKDLFDIDHCRQWFREHSKDISARNIHTRQDKKISFESFVEKSRNMSTFIEPGETERWYGKDIQCPQSWENWLRSGCVLPEKLIPEGSDDCLRFRPKKDGRSDVETLMCYFGIGDTYTPCHKDLCASSGQNLMCFTERDGSSFWIMTKSSDAAKVTDFLHSLNQELDYERHVISFEELASAPFDVYVLEQKLGDLVLVPPRSCHQVINAGGLTLKMSWSRMRLQGLATALYFELPLYHRVCRSEIYQIKSTIYYGLVSLTKELESFPTQNQGLSSDSAERLKSSTEQLRALLPLYDRILVEEYCPSWGDMNIGSRAQKQTGAAFDDFFACDFCGADIFQSYFECSGLDTSGKIGNDKTGNDESGFDANYIVCPGCYVEGRTCHCKSTQALQNKDVPLNSDEAFSSLKQLKSFFSRRTKCSIFRAAMLFHCARRQQNRGAKSCRTKFTHAVSASQAVNCKKCHAAKCFPHLLDKHKMHSIQILLSQELDETHGKYHGLHKSQPLAYEEASSVFLRAQEAGTDAPDIYIQLVYNTLKFKFCEPVSPARAKLGWYDHSSDNTRVGYSIPTSEQPQRKRDVSSKMKTKLENIRTSVATSQKKVAKNRQSKSLSDVESDLTTLLTSDPESIAWLTEETSFKNRGREKESITNDSNARTSIDSDAPLSTMISQSRKRPVSDSGQGQTSSKLAVRPSKRTRRSTTLDVKNEILDDAANNFYASLSSALNQTHKPFKKPEVVVPKRTKPPIRNNTDVLHAGSPDISIPSVLDVSASDPRANKYVDARNTRTQTEESASASRTLDQSFSNEQNDNDSRRVVLDDTQMEQIISITTERVIGRLLGGRNTLLSTLPAGFNTPGLLIPNPFGQLPLDIVTAGTLNTSSGVSAGNFLVPASQHTSRQDRSGDNEVSLQVHSVEEEQGETHIPSAAHNESLKSKGKRKQGDELPRSRNDVKKRNIIRDKQGVAQGKSKPGRIARSKSASIKPTRTAKALDGGMSLSSDSDHDDEERDSDGPV